MSELLWKRKQDNGAIAVGLTTEAFDLFGQLWSIIPVNDRKRNYTAGEPVIAVEGTDGLGSIAPGFTVKRISFIGSALERPDELTSNSVLFYAEEA